MAGLPSLDDRDTHRVRRWDVVVIGGALPGLVAAARLGVLGAQVLVVEEDVGGAAFPGLREPFWMSGGTADSVLGACLAAVGVPMIDRRNLATDPIAYQLVWPGARIDIGELETTSREFEAWRLAEPGVARALLRALGASAEAMGAALQAAQVATRRAALRAPRSEPAADAAADRSIEQILDATPALVPLIDASLRALADYGVRAPGASERNRLLGAIARGATEVSGKEPWLGTLLRRRIESRHGEFRRLSGTFRIVQAGNLPALAPADSMDISAARALIVNAPTSALEFDDAPAPTWLASTAPSARRLTLRLRGPRELVPDAMAARVISVRDPSAAMTGTNVVRIRRWDAECAGQVELIADAVVPVDASERHLIEIAQSVTSLLPLGDEGWKRVATPAARWDRDDWLSDPDDRSSGTLAGIRKPLSRVPVYVLDRAHSGRLGIEGDLMLGWRAGDTIASGLR